MLSKQSIRKEHSIFLNGELIEKDEMIEISKEFTNKEEQRFRKMLKQGGKFKINGVPFEIQLEHDSKTRSDYTKDSGVIKIPGDGRF